MPLPALTALDAATVAAARAEFASYVGELLPEIDTRHGPIHDISVLIGAVLMTALRKEIDTFTQSGSLLAVSEDPALATDEIVDRVAANYRLARGAATTASGSLTIVTSNPTPTTLASGAVFVGNGVNFTLPSAFSLRISEDELVSTADRAYRQLGVGRYAVTVPLVAATPGTSGAISRGTSLTPTSTIPDFVTAYAASDFIGGNDAETNAQLIARLQTGIAAPAWSNRTTVEAMLRDQPEFGSLTHLSIVGYGDQEMLRDARGLLPIGSGGRCDVYPRTVRVPAVVGLTKPATLVRTTSNGGIWQVSIGRDDAPGFYGVASILRPDDSPTGLGYEVYSDIRSFDLSGSRYIPDITSTFEATYSAFQTAVIQFLDTDTDVSGLTVGTTADYVVALRHMPLIGDLQAYLGRRGVRPPGGDVLVKAPVPCDLNVTITVRRKSGAAAPVTVDIQQAATAAVAALGFSGRLDTSIIAAAVQPLLPAGCVLGVIDILATIRKPNGQVQRIRTQDQLLIPSEPLTGTSPRTTLFFLDPANVAIDQVTVTTTEI